MRLIDADLLDSKAQIDSNMIHYITVEDLNNAPTIEPVKRGEWRPAIIGDRPVMICNICLEEPYRKSDMDMPNFCPNCGAKMETGGAT